MYVSVGFIHVSRSHKLQARSCAWLAAGLRSPRAHIFPARHRQARDQGDCVPVCRAQRQPKLQLHRWYECSSEWCRQDFELTNRTWAAAFEIPTSELAALLQREEEFNFVEVSFFPLNSDGGGDEPLGKGFMCTRSSDAEVLDRRRHREKYTQALQEHFGFTSVWDQLTSDSGLRPTPVYCR